MRKAEMLPLEQSRVSPALKELALEASTALAELDASKLEALAASCRELNRNPSLDSPGQAVLISEAHEIPNEMRVFARVLEGTKANMRVLDRVKELRAELPGYGPGAGRGWQSMEGVHGHN
jgi:hypothetical protein